MKKMDRKKRYNRSGYKTLNKEITVLDYIYDCSEQEKKAITEALLQNEVMKDAVESLMNLCIKKKYNKKQTENHFKVLGISLPTIIIKTILKSEGKIEIDFGMRRNFNSIENN